MKKTSSTENKNLSPEHKNTSQNEIKNTNIKAMSLISFLMNFTSGMIVSSATNFLYGQLGCSQAFLGLVRGIAEGMGNALKIIFGMMSDSFKDRKLFLMIGYGGMFILKPMFGLTALNYFSTSMRLFIYGFTHASDRLLNAMRDSVRDASIYESSDIASVGKSLGLRKFMACLGSTFGGIFAYFMLKKYSYLGAVLYSRLYFFTVIPVSMAMFILVFFVKDLFKEQYKNDKTNIFAVDYQSNNKLLGPLMTETTVSFGLGFLILVGGLGFINLLCKWDFHIIQNLELLTFLSKGLSLSLIGLLVLEIFLVKIYPNFFNKDENYGFVFKIINMIFVGLIGMTLGQIFLLILNNQETLSSGVYALKETFINYGLNGTIIIPFMLIFKFIFYKLYGKMQNILEFYSPQLKIYDKIIILNFILAFSKYSDIFLFQHITTNCGWNQVNNSLLFAFLYFFFGVFSYILGKLSDGFFKKYSIGMLVAVNLSFNLLAGFLNIMPLAWRPILGFASLILYGIYVGFVDCVLVSLVSKSVPANHLLATLLGLFYLLIGVGNTSASYMVGAIFKDVISAYRFAIIPSLLGVAYFIYNYKFFMGYEK